MSYRHCITSPTIFYCWLCLLSITIISTADAAALTKDQYVVHGLAEIEPAFDSFEGDMYAGLIPTTLLSDLQNADDSPGKLMFWLFEADNVTNDDAIVIWMNGGPGCSSLSGCLFEHGPVTVPLHPAGFYGTDDDPKTLEPNRYTWTKATRMLYVEQPHGVGFGYGPDPINEMEVGENFYNFLQNFYTIFDTLLDKKLYLFGESYAGMYVPSIAHAIHEGNKKQKTQQLEQSLVTINLQGIGVGNGWIDVMIQGPTVIDYLWWHGMLDMYTARELHQSWENCVGGVPARHPFHNFTTPDECGVGNVALLSAGDDLLDWGTPNVYDITTFDK